MDKNKLLISTIADDDTALAEEYSLGLEIAEYCTAWNMDDCFAETDRLVADKMKSASFFTFHAPFNELHPSAIDRKALALAKERYLQAVTLSYEHYHIKKIIVHSGFIPLVYHPLWFEERSVIFWKEILSEIPNDVTLCYENVMEDGPEMLLNVLLGVDDPRFRFCFDAGHASAVQKEADVIGWLKTWAPYIAHFHIHNNYGERDTHNSLGEGRIDMAAFLREAEELCPEATYTIENAHARGSVEFLVSKGILVPQKGGNVSEDDRRRA